MSTRAPSFRFCALTALGLGLIATLSLQADLAPAQEGATIVTTAPVTDPVLAGQHYRQVLSRPEFQDTGETDVNSRFKDWLSQWFLHLGAKFGEFKYASRMPAFESLLMTLLAALCVSGLLYIMGRLTRRRSVAGLDSENELPARRVFKAPEHYDAEISRAVESGNWHAAWLTAWRQFLARLEKRRLVEADRTRTNREYLAQLRVQPLPDTALRLVTGMVEAYDRFIYGRQVIGEAEWTHFHRQIDEAGLLLHLDDKGANTRKNAGGR